MKYFLKVLCISCLFFSALSCQDEFCADPTTPQLIIRLRDSENTDDTKSLPIYVWSTNKDTIIGLVSTDSITIPLNTQTNSTTYHISTSNNVEDITINYETEDIFVDRSCGFKSIFKNVNITTTTNEWIKNTELTTNVIENENQAHLNIFH